MQNALMYHQVQVIRS